MSFHPGVIAASILRAADGSGEEPGDPALWSDVVLLISAEGATAGKYGFGNIADAPVLVENCSLSASSKLVEVSSATSPFAGGKSFVFTDGSSNVRHLKVHGSQAKIFSGAFTLEGFACSTVWSNDKVIVSGYDTTGGSAFSWDLRYSGSISTTSLMFRYRDASNVEQSATFSLPPLNTWFHWCVERDATDKVRVYIDGSMVASFVGAPFRDTAQSWWRIGSSANSLSADVFWGYMAEIRLTKSALYASDAGFTVPTGAFPRGDGIGSDPHFEDVVYLMQDHADTTDPALNLTPDRSRIGHVLSANGNVFTTSNQRGTRAGDWNFNGSTFSTRWITGAAASLFNFHDRTIPFTAEAFIRPASGALSGSVCVILGMYDTSPAARQWLLYLNAGRPGMILSSDGSTAVQTFHSTALTADTWYHVALCRDANAVYRVFLDGTQVVEETDFQAVDLYNPAAADQQFLVGSSYATSQAFVGQIHGVRVTHGVDRCSGTGAPSADMFPAYGIAT